MSNDSPTLSTYEEMADVEFDLEGEDFDRDAIDQALEDLHSS